MTRFLRLLNYVRPYKWYVVQNVVYNILGAFFALFSFAMVIPFLRVIFENQPLVLEPMEFHLSTKYMMHTLNYYMGQIMGTHDVAGAMLHQDLLPRKRQDALWGRDSFPAYSEVSSSSFC